MKFFFKSKLFVLFLSTTFIGASIFHQKNTIQSIDEKVHQIKILFIGNSYTYFNDLPRIVAQMANDSQTEIKLKTKEIAKGGFTLSAHFFNADETLKVIKNGNWDYVVLQEQSVRPIENPKLFFEYVGKLNHEISKSGAQTILFMTWANKHRPNSIHEISKAYFDASEKNKTLVAPVGLAWETCRKKYPLIELYNPDGSHPSLEGSYLTACIFYSILLNEKPSGEIKGIEKETALALEEIAWETYKEMK